MPKSSHGFLYAVCLSAFVERILCIVDINYSLTGIRLPENKKLVGRLMRCSIAISLIVITVSIAIFSGMLNKISGYVDSLVLLAFILSALSLLLVGWCKTYEKTLKYRIVVISRTLCNVSVLIIGAYYLVNFLSGEYTALESNTLISIVHQKNVILIVGLEFLLLGSALMLPLIKTIHRFHLVHVLVLIILSLNSITILGYIYQLFSPPSTHIINMPLNIALIFFMLCAATALRWPTRGFIGLLTTDSASSIFALRMLIISIATISLIGIITMLGVMLGVYSPYESVAVFAILLMVLFTGLTWINTKLLYRSELERFFMREELRVHNIDLKLDNEDLAKRMTLLQKANGEYVDKLNFRSKYAEALETKG